MGSFEFLLRGVYTVGIITVGVSLNKMEELEEGKSFGTFLDLDNYLKEYEKSKFVQLYKRSSHTIEYHQKKLKQQRNMNPKLKYARLEYACIHGGKNFKSNSEGERQIQQKCTRYLKINQDYIDYFLKYICHQIWCIFLKLFKIMM